MSDLQVVGVSKCKRVGLIVSGHWKFGKMCDGMQQRHDIRWHILVSQSMFMSDCLILEQLILFFSSCTIYYIPAAYLLLKQMLCLLLAIECFVCRQLTITIAENARKKKQLPTG